LADAERFRIEGKDSGPAWDQCPHPRSSFLSLANVTDEPRAAAWRRLSSNDNAASSGSPPFEIARPVSALALAPGSAFSSSPKLPPTLGRKLEHLRAIVARPANDRDAQLFVRNPSPIASDGAPPAFTLGTPSIRSIRSRFARPTEANRPSGIQAAQDVLTDECSFLVSVLRTFHFTGN
jgi:hypothetical protein